MSFENLLKLAAFIRQERDALLSEWRVEVRQLPVARDLDVPTLNDHLPLLLEELACELEASCDDTMIEGLKNSPVIHGLERLRIGFDVQEVVAEYNSLRSVIQNLSERHGLSLHGQANHIVNRVIDGAIGLAVQTYATQKALEVQQKREEHLSFVMHDLRTPLSVIAMATQLLNKNLDAAMDERSTQLVETLHRNVNHLNALVSRVVQEEANLKTDYGEKLIRRPLELKKIIDGLINDLQPLAETSNATVVNEVPADLAYFQSACTVKKSAMRRVPGSSSSSTFAITRTLSLATVSAGHAPRKCIRNFTRRCSAGRPNFWSAATCRRFCLISWPSMNPDQSADRSAHSKSAVIS